MESYEINDICKLSIFGTVRGNAHLELSAVLLDFDSGQIRGPKDFISFRNLSSDDGSISLYTNPQTSILSLNFGRISDYVEKVIVFVGLSDGSTFSNVDGIGCSLAINGPGWMHGVDPMPIEARSIALGVFVKNDREIWTFHPIVRPHVKSIENIIDHFGLTIEEVKSHDVVLEKIHQISKTDVDFASSALIAYDCIGSEGLKGEKFKVALVIDISESMVEHFVSGAIRNIIKRALSLGFQMDDDGVIDLVVFGLNAYDYGSVNTNTYSSLDQNIRSDHQLEGSTMYGEALQMVRRHYSPYSDKVPVFCIFVTDGETRDPDKTERQIVDASQEPLYIKFVAIGDKPENEYGHKYLPHGFSFLRHLDNLPGRIIDNTSFFSIENPFLVDDETMFKLLLDDINRWLEQIRDHNLIPRSRHK